MLCHIAESSLPFSPTDPAAPPPNIYVIPDLMGSTLAPHTAQINWRPITPESKWTFSQLIINPIKYYSSCAGFYGTSILVFLIKSQFFT